MDWGNAIVKNITKEGDKISSIQAVLNPDGDVKKVSNTPPSTFHCVFGVPPRGDIVGMKRLLDCALPKIELLTYFFNPV